MLPEPSHLQTSVPDVSAFPHRRGASGPKLSLWPLPRLGAPL